MTHATREARNAYLARWRAKNRERIRARGRAWAQKQRATPEGRAESNQKSREWRARNGDTVRLKNREWMRADRIANPEKYQDIERRRRLRRTAKQRARRNRREARRVQLARAISPEFREYQNQKLRDCRDRLLEQAVLARLELDPLASVFIGAQDEPTS